VIHCVLVLTDDPQIGTNLRVSADEDGISIGVADRERLERLVRERNTPQKLMWRLQKEPAYGPSAGSVAMDGVLKMQPAGRA
jgi:hypothetical protein